MPDAADPWEHRGQTPWRRRTGYGACHRHPARARDVGRAKGRTEGRWQREEMADRNEAQLLSDLLRDIAREDARLDAAHLEMRVIGAADGFASARAMQPSLGATRATRWAIAAAVAAAVLAPAMFWLTDGNPGEKAELKVNATEEVVAEASNADSRGPAQGSGPAKAG